MLRRTAHTTSIKKTEISEEGYIVFSHYYNLPNRKVLFLTSDQDRKTTDLKIFSMDDLTNCLHKLRLDHFRLLCVNSDGSLLLSNYYYLMKLDSKLTPVSCQEFKNYLKVCAIDNENFFTITKKDGSLFSDNPAEHNLTIYKWNGDNHAKYNTVPFPGYLKHRSSSMSNIKHLKNNRYCCHIQGHNTDEFSILIFEIDAKTYNMREIGAIEPKAQYRGSGSGASGDIIVLPQGQLLTYHSCYDNLQIWDTETLQCINEWNWADIKKPDNFKIWCIDIWAFPDAVHLLVRNGEALYLFNTDKLELTKIELPNKFKIDSIANNHHILANGQILAFKWLLGQSKVEALHFDLKEMIHFREKMTDYKVSKYISRLFLNTQLVPDVTNQILPLAFNPEVEEEVAKKAYDDFGKTGERTGCPIM